MGIPWPVTFILSDDVGLVSTFGNHVSGHDETWSLSYPLFPSNK